MPDTLTIMDSDALTHALRRIAHEILDQDPDPATFALVGIPLRGHELARRLADFIMQIEGHRPQTGVVDVSMHRDDLVKVRLQNVDNEPDSVKLEKLMA